MPVIPVAEWVPDAADFGNPGSIVIKNALPGLNSYQPLNSLVTNTDALAARPRGALEAKDSAGNVYQYAGDASKIYSLSGGVWSDVSLGGGYSTSSSERWEFIRWKEKILATNFDDNPQSITLGGANFANLTTALRCRHLAGVRDFVVAGSTWDSTDGEVRDRVWWSAINDETDWTPSATTLSDFRDLKVGGGVQRIVGGEFGVVLSEKSIFRMTFVGSPTIFQIDEVMPGVGLLAPGGAVKLAGIVFFMSDNGFIALQGGASPTFIGEGKVDKFFRNDIDEDYLDRVSSVADPTSGKVFWAYPGAGNTAGRPNKIISYDRVLNRWGYAEVDVELIWRSGGVATTLEQLDDANLGAELVSNGDFATDTIWTKGTGWTIGSGTATHGTGTASDLSQAVSITQDVYYRLEFDVSGRTAGSVTPKVGNTSGTAISADTTDEKESIRAGAGTDVTFSATSDFDGSIDNVSLKEIDDIDSMTVSFDDAQWKGGTANLSAFNANFENANFSGTPMTATVETKEIEINPGRVTQLNAFAPLVDGGTVTARVGTRNRQSDSVTYSATLNQSASGRFTVRANARFHRLELTASGTWGDIIGVQINPREDAKQAGRRG